MTTLTQLSTNKYWQYALWLALFTNFYTCEPRGQVIVKGKGEMDTWFLIGAKRGAETSGIM